MTTMWGNASYAVFDAVELYWCAECEGEEIFDRPLSPDSAEAFCVSCGTAVFLWVERIDAPSAARTDSAMASPAA